MPSPISLHCTIPAYGELDEGLEPEADEKVANEVDDEEEVGSEVDAQQQQVVPPETIV